MAEIHSTITDQQFLNQVLNTLDKDYESQVNLIEQRVDDASNPLKIEEMRDELCLRYERLMKNGSGGLENEVEEEQALYAGHQFKGKCYVCGKIGHKGANFRERTNKHNARFQGRGGKEMGFGQGMNRGRGFKGNCNYCHRFGHKPADCIKKKNNLENRGNSNVLGRRQDNPDSSLVVQEIEVPYMAEEIEFGYCVHCGGRGPLGTFCDR
jgi:hypothetical protein